MLSKPAPPPEPLPLPSQLRAAQFDPAVPKYLRFRSTLDNPAELPKFLTGVEPQKTRPGSRGGNGMPTSAPLGPRKAADSDSENDGDDTVLAVRGASRGRRRLHGTAGLHPSDGDGAGPLAGRVGRKGKPFAKLPEADRLGRQLPPSTAKAYKSKSLQELRSEKHTAATIYDVLASDDVPLAARQYEKMREEQRVGACHCDTSSSRL